MAASARSAAPRQIATHGMAMTLWLTSERGLEDPVRFWDDLRFPDLFRVHLRAGTVERVSLAD
jgi:hypothetical protein